MWGGFSFPKWFLNLINPQSFTATKFLFYIYKLPDSEA